MKSSVFFLITLLFTAAFIYRHRDIRVSEIIKRGNTLVRNIVYQATGPKLSHESDFWKSAAKTLTLEKDLRLLAVFDLHNREIYQKNFTQNYTNKNLSKARSRIIEMPRTYMYTVKENGELRYYEFYASLFSDHADKREVNKILALTPGENPKILPEVSALRKEILGIVLVVISGEQVEATFKRDLNIIILIVLVCVSIALLASFYFSKKILQPVLSLMENMEKLRTGNKFEKLKERGNDEIAMLSATFNRMAEEIQEKAQELSDAYNEIKQFNQILEERV